MDPVAKAIERLTTIIALASITMAVGFFAIVIAITS